MRGICALDGAMGRARLGQPIAPWRSSNAILLLTMTQLPSSI